MPLDGPGRRQADPSGACDYVVVGSGAGGGTVAARLAEGGARVVLLEAGGDACATDAPRLPEDYEVPAFHAYASENPAMSWDFRVRHYDDPARQARDPKAGPEGVFYPRAGTLGGCTAHNAMIFLHPPDADWDAIAALTGDESWRASAMRRYVERLEDCRHRPVWRLLAKLGIDWTGHGWHGWLPVEKAMPPEVWHDRVLVRSLFAEAAREVLDSRAPLVRLWRLLLGRADPNDRRLLRRNAEGLCYTPLSTDGHRRFGARERLRDVAERMPDNLRIVLHALATKVLFDEAGRATGVEYFAGRSLYRATPGGGREGGERRVVRCAREVILCGGAFNTPQLLMLSGIGDPAELTRHSIAVRVDLPGVGRNLQDRYEVAVVSRMRRRWRVLRGAQFRRGDRLFAQWSAARRRGMYVSNGAALGFSARSDPALPVPDLFCMALLARFAGYRPGYSAEVAAHHDRLSWAILKARTANRAGRVTLRSADPRDVPDLSFRYFDEGDHDGGRDLRAVTDAIRTVRRLLAPLHRDGLLAEEELPGADVQSDEALANFVRDNAWGHHASCTCAIGPREQGGVLDSRFRVHGVERLRVVDASVFPRIPGFFIAAAIYLAAEKAADVILEDARSSAAVARAAA